MKIILFLETSSTIVPSKKTFLFKDTFRLPPFLYILSTASIKTI